MSPEEAKAKIEDIARLISYEQNLQKHSEYKNDYKTIKLSKNIVKRYYEEIERYRKFL